MCIHVCLYGDMSSVDTGVPRVQSDSWMLELELQESETPLCGCRQLNSGPLQRATVCVLLTAAASLHQPFALSTNFVHLHLLCSVLVPSKRLISPIYLKDFLSQFKACLC